MFYLANETVDPTHLRVHNAFEDAVGDHLARLVSAENRIVELAVVFVSGTSSAVD